MQETEIPLTKFGRLIVSISKQSAQLWVIPHVNVCVACADKSTGLS